MKQRTKALLVDILGFSLIIMSPFLGWLPGPGGIPMLILGLSLLANNHEWAERILERVKHHVGKAAEQISGSDPVTKWGIDILSVVFIAGAVILITQFTRSIAMTAAISFTIVGITLLLTNQNRYCRLWEKLRSKHKH